MSPEAFQAWWAARVVRDAEAPAIAREALRASWCAWCHLKGEPPGLSSVFYARVLVQDGVSKDSAVNCLRGVRLRT